jgi:long-chain fatty acid transport protein
MPSVAVRVHEKFSIAAGVNMMYAHMEYDVGAPPGGPGQVQMDDLSDFKPGAVVSALWEPREDTRVGVLWQQEIELKLSGTIGFAGGAGPGDVALKLQMPFAQAVRASVLHEITPNLWLAGSFRWEDWSTFQEQWVFFPGFSTQLIRGWDDTFGGSLGLRWQFSNRWALLTGVGYDSSPVNASFRTADLPVDRQIRVAVGTQYAWSENTVIGFNFSYANLGDATIASDTLTGQYDDNDLYAVAFYVGWKRLPWSRLAK